MKTVRNVKNSLKFKAQSKPGALTVRVGVKKYNIPIEARMLAGDGYLFLSFPAVSEIYKIDKSGLTAMEGEGDAGDAFTALNPGRRKRGTRGRRASAELPEDIAKVLAGIPAGFRLGYGPDGTPRLVKTRVRKPRAKKA